MLKLCILKSFLHARARHGLEAKLLRRPFLPCPQGVFIERDGGNDRLRKACHACGDWVCLGTKRCKQRVVLIFFRRHQLGGSKRVLLCNAPKLCILIFRPCVLYPLALRAAHEIAGRKPLLHGVSIPLGQGVLGLSQLCLKGLPICLLRLFYLRVDALQRSGLCSQKAAPLFLVGAHVRPAVCRAGALAHQRFQLLL